MISLRQIKVYCKDDFTKIENYEKAISDNTQTWQLHHRLETHKYKDRSRKEWIERDEQVSADELNAFGLYFNRPAEELIFMTKSDHMRLHSKGKPKSEEHKRNLSKSKKAYYDRLRECGMQIVTKPKKKQTTNKVYKLSEEHRQKISKGLQGIKRSEETRKKMSEASKIREANRRKEKENEVAL